MPRFNRLLISQRLSPDAAHQRRDQNGAPLRVGRRAPTRVRSRSQCPWDPIPSVLRGAAVRSTSNPGSGDTHVSAS